MSNREYDSTMTMTTHATWWQDESGRWFPPADGKVYGVPPWREPADVKTLGVGKVRDPRAVIALSVVTLGVYFLYWSYQSFKTMRAFRGKGVGGWWGLVFALPFGVISAFVLPMEVGLYFSEQNDSPPVFGEQGFWILAPLVGFLVLLYEVQSWWKVIGILAPLVGYLIWLYQVQCSMNTIWKSYPAQGAMDEARVADSTQNAH